MRRKASSLSALTAGLLAGFHAGRDTSENDIKIALGETIPPSTRFPVGTAAAYSRSQANSLELHRGSISTSPDKATTAEGVLRYLRSMSIESPAQAAPGDSDKKRLSFLRWWESPRAIAFTALAIALIAVAGAVAAWLLPPPEHFSGQQSAQAKTNVCTTYAIVRNAVAQGSPNPRPDDPVSQEAVAANVRLAMIGGSSYLRETLDAEPATPADLTKAVKSMANTLDQLGFAFLLRTDGDTKQKFGQALHSKIVQIDQICAPKKK